MTDRPTRALLVRVAIHAVLWSGAIGFAALALLNAIAQDQAAWLVGLHAVTPIAYLPAVLLLPAALHQRLIGPFALLLGTSLCWAAWTLPALDPSTGPTGTVADLPSVRVVTANLAVDNPRPYALLAELLAEEPDILVLEEVTPRWSEILAASQITERYPYRVIEPRDDPFGIALLSRLPVSSTWLTTTTGVPYAHARVMVGNRSLTVHAVHARPPLDDVLVARWRSDLQEIQSFMWSQSTPAVVAGDYNLPRYTRSYEELSWTGFRDAHADRGRRSARTWPNLGVSLLRPDQIWVNDQISVRRIWEGSGTGSDHRPVFADLSFRR